MRQVCTELQLPYFRLGRQKMTYAYDKLVPVDSKKRRQLISPEFPETFC
ncbi:MAG: hypothetical protein ACLSFT_03415 [Ruminococcus callidus]